jgi:hypothetical protein
MSTSPGRSIRSSPPHPKPSRQRLDIYRSISADARAVGDAQRRAGALLRRLSRVPGGYADKVTHVVASATQAPVAGFDLHAGFGGAFAGLIPRVYACVDSSARAAWNRRPLHVGYVPIRRTR